MPLRTRHQAASDRVIHILIVASALVGLALLVALASELACP